MASPAGGSSFLGHCFRFKVPGQPGLRQQRGIMLTEVFANDLERHVKEGASIAEIFHVAAPGAIELLEERIDAPIEFEDVYAETLA